MITTTPPGIGLELSKRPVLALGRSIEAKIGIIGTGAVIDQKVVPLQANHIAVDDGLATRRRGLHDHARQGLERRLLAAAQEHRATGLHAGVTQRVVQHRVDPSRVDRRTHLHGVRVGTGVLRRGTEDLGQLAGRIAEVPDVLVIRALVVLANIARNQHRATRVRPRGRQQLGRIRPRVIDRVRIYPRVVK